MGITIENPETERLIHELAEKTGKGRTEAVTDAVREALERLNEEGRATRVSEALMKIAEQTAQLLKGFDMDDAMYGPNGRYDRETGLPK